MNPIIDIQTLGKTFRGKKRDTSVVAIKDLSLQVKPGKIFGFVGPNGAGKSTTIKILLGFIKADHGTATLCNMPVKSEQCRNRVGYLPENPVFHDFLTTKEVLETTAVLRGVAKQHITKEVTDLLEKVELRESSNRPIRGFSKGMTQRLGIANALVGDPDLLILDEPMSGLDPLGRNLVRELMLEQREKGKTIFFSSHILHDVETICDEVGILLQGELKFQGKLATITNQQAGSFVLQFKSEKKYPDLAIFLEKHQLSLNSITADIFELTVPQKALSEILTSLIDLQCQIVNLQQHHPSLENFFMKLVNDNEKII
ncbi:MAG: ABC transporter ATP-binding protein [Desulfobacterales bacterium]|nr:ABC transporter ATP-binding protein [Desulfobacterales bacterium]